MLASPAGNTATVKSLSGTSSKCQDPAIPIRARLEFTYNFSTKAGIDLPEGYEPSALNDFQRFEGALLKAEDRKGRGVFVNVAPRNSAVDLQTRALNVAGKMSTLIDKAVVSNPETLNIGGLPTARLEVRGNNKNLFARSFVYVVTVMEAENEVVVVNAWSPSESDLDSLRTIPSRITGLTPPANASTAISVAVTPPIAAASAPEAAASAPVPVVASVVPVAALQAAPQPTALPMPVPSASPAVLAAPTQPVADKLRELDKLRKEGVITQKDFELKKQELLKAM